MMKIKREHVLYYLKEKEKEQGGYYGTDIAILAKELEDEINRLKGGKGKQKVSPKTVEKEVDIQNQKGDGEGKKNWRKSAKKPRIKEGTGRSGDHPSFLRVKSPIS